MAVSGQCKKVTTNYNRVFYGVGPRVGASDSYCSSNGYRNGLYFECAWNPYASKPLEQGQSFCFFNDEAVVRIEDADDSNCGNCIAGKYDCVNGSCIDSGVYKTPGKYATLEECQSNCGSTVNSCNPPFQCIDPTNFCPPGKVCLEQNEWTQIKGLIAQNKAKHCK